ncbi:MAG TPA: type II secretion system F family protein [Candidatus Binatia bacterium]|jgi:type II secretory pathway component PulF|nr:type II secretion system F family protein [Candidatus Binatia bacterium]
MNAFRYHAIEATGTPVQGVIEAEDRKAALQLLGQRGLFPSILENSGVRGAPLAGTTQTTDRSAAFPFRPAETQEIRGVGATRSARRIRRKDITAFTREMSALLASAIPIPQALEGLGEEEENPALRQVILNLSESVRKGTSLSAALDEQPRLFSKLYVSMVRVGEEAGALQTVMADLAELLEHEDEVRGEVLAAVAYPVFVLGFGVVTVTLLLTVVLPRLFGMLQEMLQILPLPTLILLKVSGTLHRYWYLFLAGIAGVSGGLRWYLRTTAGAELWDKTKLRLPLLGSVFRSAALSRFARTLGTLAKSGVSLLPALKIVENTIGNRMLAQQIARVAEDTRGGHSLATPLRKLGVFPRTIVQMIDVGEESGRLDEMLLKVAEIEERHMRARTKTLISLLAPILILVVGSLVGFIVIAILLPIFRMSQAIH